MLSRCLHDCQMSDMKLRRGAAASGKSRRRIEKAFRPKISGGLQAALALRLTRFYYYDRAAAKYVYKKHCFLYISNHALIIFPVVLSLDHHLSPPYFFLEVKSSAHGKNIFMTIFH